MVFIVCFLGMIVMIVETQKKSFHLDGAWSGHITSMNKYINNNAAYYGLAKISDKTKITNGLNEYLRNSFPSIYQKNRETQDLLKYKRPEFNHPLYVELQKRSPLSHYNKKDSKLDYTIDEVDAELESGPKKKIDIRDFYTKYVSRSIPLVMRNYSKDWRITKEI